MGPFPAGQDAFGLKSGVKPSQGFVNAYNLPSQSSQAIERMLHPRQGKLITMSLQIPITEPTDDRQVLRFPIGFIPIQVIDRQSMQSHGDIFRSPAILTPIFSTDLGKPGHSTRGIQPFLMPGLEETVYLLLGSEPLPTHFPSPEPTRPRIRFHPPMRPSTIPASFSRGNQFRYFGFFSLSSIHHPPPHFPVKPGGPLSIERMFYIIPQKLPLDKRTKVCYNMHVTHLIG